MFRRLATIAVGLTLAGCSEHFSLPTEVTTQQNIDDGTTVPPEMCQEYIVDDASALIPGCVNPPYWPEGTLFSRARHGHEAVGVAAGGRARAGAASRAF